MEYQEIMTRNQELLARAVKPIPEDRLKKERDLYQKRNRRSLEIFEKARHLIPGGVEHNLSQSKPFPLAMDRAKGYHMWDVDGNVYVDYLMSGAPIILGHAFDPLDEKIIEIIREKGPATGLTSEYEPLAAEEIIRHMPGVEMVRFLQSGTEADMAAPHRPGLHGKQKIKVGGSYHGGRIRWSFPCTCPAAAQLPGHHSREPCPPHRR